MDLKLKLYSSLCLRILCSDGKRLQEQMSLIVSNAFLFPSNTPCYGFICLRDEIIVYGLCYLGLWNACSEGTPLASHNK